MLSALKGQGQRRMIDQMGRGNLPMGGSGSGGAGGSDSLKRRDKLEDSITISFRYLDSAFNYRLDSSISDPAAIFPVPYTHHYLGNIGSPAQSMLFQPRGRAGWDPGFHAFDVYRWTTEKARFFTTTRPFTELGFVLGSGQQQIINITHTQNLKPYWNVLLQYRLINSPGFYKNQKTAHNNYLFTSWYQSPNRRYNNFLVLVGNKIQAAENGGIRDVSDLEDPNIPDRFSILTRLGKNTGFSNDFFSSNIVTGTKQNDFTALLRQQFDFGRKDSLVTDSTVVPLFFPQLRFEHTINYSEYKYRFSDLEADSATYQDVFNVRLPSIIDTFLARDKWTEVKNDFSIYQFPDAKNLNQFFKVGAEYQYLQGFLRNRVQYHNISARGEYRNRTRNQKWDLNAWGRLWLAGYNAGDYHAFVSLQRTISRRLGTLRAGAENLNREPSFVYNERSQFYRDAPTALAKENTTHFFGTLFNPALKLQLGADYYLVANYLYFTDASKIGQERGLFNLLRLSALKTLRLGRRWNLFSEVYLQQLAGNAALNVPLLFTRNRIQYDGNFGFKNLTVAVGAEMRYHTPYKADGYSPLISQFTFQDSLLIKNRPDVNVFFNFRIRSFKAYLRAENLNTLQLGEEMGFRKENLAAPHYPYPGLILRFGFLWSFVN